MTVVLDIDAGPVLRFLEIAEDAVNAEFNDGLGRLGGAFFRRFARERLGGRGSGVRVRRTVGRQSERSAVRIPKRARAMGFVARLAPRGRLSGKTLTMGTSNRIAIGHEVGATIVARRRRLLTIRTRNRAEARRRGIKPKGRPPFVLRRVRRVRLQPRLGYIRTWQRFLPEARDRLAKMSARGVRAGARAARRRGGRFARAA